MSVTWKSWWIYITSSPLDIKFVLFIMRSLKDTVQTTTLLDNSSLSNQGNASFLRPWTEATLLTKVGLCRSLITSATDLV